MIRGLSLAIVNAQLLISLGWFLRLWPRIALVSGLILLSLYTAGFAYQLRFGEPPECHCIMLMDQFFQGQDKAKYTIIRNIVMIACLVVGMISWRRPRPTDSAPDVAIKSSST